MNFDANKENAVPNSILDETSTTLNPRRVSIARALAEAGILAPGEQPSPDQERPQQPRRRRRKIRPRLSAKSCIEQLFRTEEQKEEEDHDRRVRVCIRGEQQQQQQQQEDEQPDAETLEKATFENNLERFCLNPSADFKYLGAVPSRERLLQLALAEQPQQDLASMLLLGMGDTRGNARRAEIALRRILNDILWRTPNDYGPPCTIEERAACAKLLCEQCIFTRIMAMHELGVGLPVADYEAVMMWAAVYQNDWYRRITGVFKIGAPTKVPKNVTPEESRLIGAAKITMQCLPEATQMEIHAKSMEIFASILDNIKEKVIRHTTNRRTTRPGNRSPVV